MIYIFEGMDNCLKDTLIQILRGRLSPKTQIFKFSSPPEGVNAQEYQRIHFKDMFEILSLSISNSDRNLILNRAHLGEYIYSPIYRNYKGDWVFSLEKEFLRSPQNNANTKLILLYDSDNDQLKLREDGKSFSQNRDEQLNAERTLFLEAFDKSLISNKIRFDLSDYLLDDNEIDKDLIINEILK